MEDSKCAAICTNQTQNAAERILNSPTVFCLLLLPTVWIFIVLSAVLTATTLGDHIPIRIS